MTTKGMTTFVPVAAAIAIAAGFLLGGCKGTRPGSLQSQPTTPNVSQVTQQAAVEVGQAASTISTHTHKIDAAAPDLHAATLPIHGAVEDLHATKAKLEAVTVQAKTADKRTEQLIADIRKADKRIAELEAEQTSLLNRLLTFGAIAGLGLAVIGGVWLKSFNAALTGLSVFAVCVAGQWILAYRAIIAIVALSLVAIVTGWKLVKERFAAQQLVTTIEGAKGTSAIADWDTFKTVANTIQGKYTKRLVDQVQRSIGVRKAKP